MAAFASAWVRYDLRVDEILSRPIARFATIAAAVYLVCGLLIGPYRIGHLRGSFEETADIARAAAASAIPMALAMLLTPWFTGVPRSMAILVPILAVVGMFTSRFVVRSYRHDRRPALVHLRKVIVFGAGLSGRQLVRALQNDADTSFAPVALLDDDPHKRRLKIDGLRVRGSRKMIGEVAAATGASALVVALPSADAHLIRDLRSRARDAHLDVLTLPPTDQLIGAPKSGDLRELDLEDLLGRRRVRLDEGSIAAAIAGKTVLVTGAGGSIGSELARQISRFGPRKLILLDRDESALHATQLSLTGRALLDDDTLALASIRDLGALRAIFKAQCPEIVYHAAALKHLPLLEQFPLEAWKTNVLGTLNVLEVSAECDVEVFVNVSTDKAADPTSVLGYSKRLAERLTSHYADQQGGSRFVSVRFGNVLGSRGSVIEAFTKQVQRDGPVTVTDPDVQRYFMLIPEASQLVLQASAIGSDGDVLVLDMGQPVKILDVAQALIDLSGRSNIEIVFTGLRPGEKRSEDLFTSGEQIRPTSHPLVRRVSVPAINPLDVRRADLLDPLDALDWMRTHAVSCASLSPLLASDDRSEVRAAEIAAGIRRSRESRL
ncbi:dTDP-glucose 4,6-dehydratase [Microlunatus endophyticus]|uniref:dTDP-glucose 4,6-dehydratase n=1 Tax=Microlunatus endophyticus TaxID=1716077 RepID=A0A917W9Q3_9ACTN|nr:nucleoside-diphosphate sugar epimerase/dehydratase [Microlunatus endophyticus]GGL83343.1 dTDP-glucose 4,6-dehydratase [Microlunatus endophyticus]